MADLLEDILANVEKTNSITAELDFDFDTPDVEDIQVEQLITAIADESGGSLKFAILGLGQCGGRLAQAFHDLGYKKNIVINTSYHDLADLTIPNKLKVGTTDGAGKNMEVSAGAFSKEKSNILLLMHKIYGQDVDHIIVCAGAGGGTGSGTIVPAIELSKIYLKQIGLEDAEQRVGAIATIPTNNESSSPLVKQNSLKVLTTLSEMANNKQISPFIIIDNDRVKTLFPRLTVTQFYPTINKTIVQLFHTFNVISTKESDLISFDKADYKSIINSSGHMVMGAITVKDYSSSESISKALRNNIETTLLADEFDLETASVVGIIILGGKEIFDSVPGLMTSIEDAFGTISFLTNQATVHRGLYTNNSNTLKVFTLIGGLKEPIRRYRKIVNI
jgi:cell division GTPase FtsZ